MHLVEGVVMSDGWSYSSVWPYQLLVVTLCLTRAAIRCGFFARPNPDPSFLVQHSSCDFVVLQHFVSGHIVWENTQKAVTLILPADCFFMSTFVMSYCLLEIKKTKKTNCSAIKCSLSALKFPQMVLSDSRLLRGGLLSSPSYCLVPMNCESRQD